MERGKRESERRRQSELPTGIIDKPKRLIPVDPIISPFDSGEDKVSGEGTYVPYRPTCHDLKEILWVPNFYYIGQICYLRLGVRSSGFTHD